MQIETEEEINTDLVDHPLLKDKDLPEDVREELTDEKFSSRLHYSRATYAKGCRGPLCRLAERDRGRDRSERQAEQAGRDYEPNEEERERRGSDYEKDKKLYKIVVRHHYEMEMKRLQKRAARRWGPV
jgi:hypothetical protein